MSTDQWADEEGYVLVGWSDNGRRTWLEPYTEDNGDHALRILHEKDNEHETVMTLNSSQIDDLRRWLNQKHKR